MRRSDRIAVDETARLRPNSWSSIEVRIVDLSATGFRAECEATIHRGSAVWLDLPGIGEVEAQVSWRRRDEIGARFIVPVELERCGVEPVRSEAVLARLLVHRANARGSGSFSREQELRRRILSGLPMRKLDG